MFLSRVIIFLLSPLVLIQIVQAQTADEIIKKHIEAIGGYEKIKAIRSITFEGTNKSSKLETSFKRYIIHDSASCTEGIANGKPSKGMVTKNGGWICSPGESKHPIQKKSKYEIKQEQNSLDIHGPLVDYLKKGNKIKYSGIEKINDIDCFKIKLIKPDKSAFMYYFDSAFIIARIIWFWPGGNQSQLTYDYTYKIFDNGYSFVVKAVRLEDGAVSTYYNYIINPEINRSVFNPCK